MQLSAGYGPSLLGTTGIAARHVGSDRRWTGHGHRHGRIDTSDPNPTFSSWDGRAPVDMHSQRVAQPCYSQCQTLRAHRLRQPVRGICHPICHFVTDEGVVLLLHDTAASVRQFSRAKPGNI
jgi:hypothetical protein